MVVDGDVDGDVEGKVDEKGGEHILNNQCSACRWRGK